MSHLPWPICSRCRKPVERIESEAILDSPHRFLLTVACHGATEARPVDMIDLAPGTTIVRATAFHHDAIETS